MAFIAKESSGTQPPKIEMERQKLAVPTLVAMVCNHVILCIKTTTFLGLLLCSTIAWCQLAQPNGQGAAVHDYIRLYRKYLHGLKDVQCSMYPTCSQYGTIAFSNHSFPVAMVLTSDRLLRCGGHLDSYYEIAVDNHRGRRLDYPPGIPVPNRLMATPPNHVAAETIIPSDEATKAIQFTNMLINQHSYASALLEIERLLYKDSTLRHLPQLYLNKMRCFEGLQQYSDGLLFYEQSIPQAVKTDYKITYTAAHLYDLAGDTDHAIDLYRQASNIWDSNEVQPYGELAVLYASKSQFSEAREALENKYAIDSHPASLASSIATIERMENVRYKSPITAMLLSIVPGAGYLYLGQPRNAVVSLLLNSLLAYATYTSFRTENYGLGIIIGAFSISFYGGNITGSRSSAHRLNEKLKRNGIDELRRHNPFYY